ncbi:MAG TPA: hypothetical protein VD788_07390 [Candidatus Polarisedimenticolaceae bacterium]|nr:hypothetical protein [Candidatus Polarisedimenticolaceae bacterium]
MARRSTRGIVGLAASAVLTGALGCSPTVTDTGFAGTWASEVQVGGRSVVAIWRDGSGYRFAVNRYDADGRHHLRCTAEGECAYFDGEAPYYALEFAVRAGSNDGALYVDCKGHPLEGKEGTPIEWVERLSVEPGGIVLTAQRIELNGTPVTAMPRRFAKQSDRPRFR